jgi:hypothetical protein
MAGQSDETSKRRWFTPLKTGAGSVAVAVIAGIILLAIQQFSDPENGADRPAEPLSYSLSPVEDEPCNGGRAFVPEPAGRQVLEEGPPRNWSDLFRYPGAAFAGGSTVEVSVQGESQRTVTLTGVHVEVKDLGPRPSGRVFGGQCGGGATGRYLQIDLDSKPPRLVNAQSIFPGRFRPITFPWNVSLTDPLLLYVSASTQKCFCEWRAEIPWVSGSKRGVIMIGTPGEGFRVTGYGGLPSYYFTESGWSGPAQS